MIPTFLLTAAISAAAAPEATLKPASTVACFDVAEFVLHVEKPAFQNPFTEVECWADFSAPDGQRWRVPGFCDAQDGSVFRIRFCPDRAGVRYKYAITLRGPGIDQHFNGTLPSKPLDPTAPTGSAPTGAAPTGALPGPVIADPKHPKHFIYAGTRVPFYHLGFTAYHLLDPSNDDAQVDATIDYCVQEGFNKIRFLLTGYPRDFDKRTSKDVEYGVTNADARPNYGSLPGRVNPLPAWLGEPHHYDFTRFNVTYWQRVDRAVRRMRDRGIVATCIFTIEKQNLPGEYGALTEAELRLYRYAVARLAALDNVWWDLGNEHNEYRDVNWGNAMGAVVRAIDPFHRLISAHAYADFLYPQSDWAGFIITQQHGDPKEIHDWVLKYRDLHKPYVNEEYGYEGKTFRSGHGQDPARVRRNHWSMAMAGGYATYGDQSNDTAYFYMGVPGQGITARQLKHLRHFFEALPYRDLEVHDELTSNGFCMAAPPGHFVFYFTGGGEARIDLSSAGKNNLSARWFDPRTGWWQEGPHVRPEAGNVVKAPDGNDWVLYVHSSDPTTRPSGRSESDDATLVRKLASTLRDDVPGLSDFRTELERANKGEPAAAEKAADLLIAWFDQEWNKKDARAASAGPAVPAGAVTEKKNRQTAENAMRHCFTYGKIVQQFGAEVDWSCHRDYEWRVSLNRMTWLSRMGSVYRADKDERIASEMQHLLLSWMDASPLPERGERFVSWQKWAPEIGMNWRSLDTAIRVDHLQRTYASLIGSPTITRNTRLRLLYLLWQHIDYLKDDDWDNGNWLSLSTAAVVHAGIHWPMFHDAPLWLARGKANVETNILRDLYADGKEIEDSTGYIQFALNHLIPAYLELRQAGEVFSPEVETRIRKSIDLSAWSAFPNGHCPMIGDSTDNSPYVPLRFWKELDRPDVGYVVTQGKEGTRPAEASRGWPDGGWYVMRSPWGSRPFEQDLHLLFKASPGGGHGHPDQLSITAYGYGEPLLIDPGQVNYRKDGRDFATTAVHNTVTVDDTDQKKGPAHVDHFETSAGYDFVDASHSLYAGVTHRRRVLFLKDACWLVVDSLTSGTPHHYELNWHFPAGMEPRFETGRVLAQSPRGSGILLIPAGEPEGRTAGAPFDYHIAYEWDERTPAKGWRFNKDGTQTTFVTLLVPYSANNMPDADLTSGGFDRSPPLTVRVGRALWQIELPTQGPAIIKRR